MLVSVLASLVFSTWCLFSAPVNGTVVREFAPQGDYAGHWGIDLAVPVGTPVRAIAPGVVTFSGEVAGRPSVTVDHGGALRSSYAYLTDRLATLGQRVHIGTILGTSGIDHGIPALHLSLRVGSRYIDPARACGAMVPADGLRLAS